MIIINIIRKYLKRYINLLLQLMPLKLICQKYWTNFLQDTPGLRLSAFSSTRILRMSEQDTFCPLVRVRYLHRYLTMVHWSWLLTHGLTIMVIECVTHVIPLSNIGLGLRAHISFWSITGEFHRWYYIVIHSNSRSTQSVKFHILYKTYICSLQLYIFMLKKFSCQI